MARVRIALNVGEKKVVSETHPHPVHLDEYAAWWMIEEWADEAFLKKHAPDGVLMIGVGGGPFDEHPTLASPRKEGESAATLVAKDLGIQDDPGLIRMLEYVRSVDLGGGDVWNNLAAFSRRIGQEQSHQTAFKWAKVALEAEYAEQARFWGETRKEYERVAQVEDIQMGKREVRLVVLRSDNPQVSGYARYPKGGGAEVIIVQQRTTGHVQVFGSKRAALIDVARMIRLAELHRKGEYSAVDRITLAREGVISGAEEWWFHRAGEALLNGKPDDTEVPATRLSLEQILWIVRTGINPASLSDICPKSHCIFQRCGWYPWGLERCETIKQRSSPSRR